MNHCSIQIKINPVETELCSWELSSAGNIYAITRLITVASLLILSVVLTGCDNGDGNMSVQPPIAEEITPNPEVCTLTNDDKSIPYDLIFTDWINGPKIILANSDSGLCRELIELNGGISAAGQIAVSSNGDIAYVTWEDSSWQLYVMFLSDESTIHLATIEGGAGALPGQPSWSADGTQIAFVSFNGEPFHWDIKAVDLQGNVIQIGTVYVPDADLAPCIRPAWSPTSDELIFAGWRETNGEGLMYSADTTSNEIKELYDPPGIGSVCRPVWSHKGNKIAATYWSDANSSWILATMNTNGSNVESIVELQGGFGVGQAQWSPNDQSIAFIEYNYSIQDSVLNIVTVKNLAVNQLMPLTAGIVAGHPQWSLDGSKIAFTIYDQDVKGARVMTIPSEGGAATSIKLLGTGISAGHPQWLPAEAP